MDNIKNELLNLQNIKTNDGKHFIYIYGYIYIYLYG